MKEENKKKACSMCGQVPENEELTEFDGVLLCSECLEEKTRICSHCGERIWAVRNSGTGNTPLCEYCYEEHYIYCSRCDRLILLADSYYEEGSDETYCRDCYIEIRDDNGRAIHPYDYKPAPLFYGDGPRFFGVELEVDCGGEIDENARQILDIANVDDKTLIYCKHDGSLDDGFEIVTHPMALDYHLGKMPWKDVLTKLKELGYLSHKAGSCGLHVHVSRDAFGEDYDSKEDRIGRVIYFFEKFWDELLKFSRRTPRQLERWAARYGYKDHPKDMMDYAKGAGNKGRYSSINLYNHNTVEIRIFRGTLKYNTLVATLQLVNRIIDVAYAYDDNEIRELSWTDFVSGCTEPELIQYLKERRLYVNEPVECEEDM